VVAIEGRYYAVRRATQRLTSQFLLLLGEALLKRLALEQALGIVQNGASLLR